MAEAIAECLPASMRDQTDADALSLAVDGAIVRTQLGEPAERVLVAFERILLSMPGNSPCPR